MDSGVAWRVSQGRVTAPRAQVEVLVFAAPEA